MTVGYPMAGEVSTGRASGWPDPLSVGWPNPADVDGAPNPALEVMAIGVGLVRGAVGTVDRVLASAQRLLLR